MIFRNIILFTFLLFSILATGQRTISGVIQASENKERLPFADVIIKNTNQGTSSNVDGFFSLIDAPDSAFVIQVFYVGYSITEMTIEAGTEDISNLILDLSVGVDLEEVVISDRSYKVMNASDRLSTIQISPAQLSLLPNIGEVDIFRSLQLLPGVSGSNESSSGLFVRGGTPDQNLVLLDGMTVYNVDHFFGFFSAFNADAVKDVKLYKGAFPAKYGGRLSSVVDLTGKTGDPNKTHGSFGVNLLNARASVQVPVFKKGSFSISGRRSYTDILRSGLYNDIFGVFSQTENPPDVEGLEVTSFEPDFYFFDLNSKLSFNPTDKDVVSLSFYSGADHLVEANEVGLDRFGGAVRVALDVDEQNDWGNQGFSGKWSRQWNPKWYSNLLIASSNYFSEYNRDLDIKATLVAQDSVVLDQNIVSFEDNQVKDITLRIDNELQINNKHKLEFGLSGTTAEVDYSFVRNGNETILDRSQKSNYWAAYISDTWQATKNLTVNAGIRSTYYNISDQIYWSPRLSFEYNLSDRLKIKGGYGNHYQFVNRIVNENITEGSRDFWLLADDDLVKVSSAEHFIGGLSYETDNFIFDVEGYRKDLRNLSEFSLRFQRNDIDTDRLFFNGTGYTEGVEFLAQKKKGAYTAWISYTLARVRNNFPELNNGFEFSALHDQLHELKTVHSYELDGFRFAVTFIYASGKPFTEPSGQYAIDLLDGGSNSYISVGPKNGSRLPAYHRMDLSAHYLYEKNGLDFDIGLSIFNVYGRQNVWYRSYDFTEHPPIITEAKFLGLTPNLSFDVKF